MSCSPSSAGHAPGAASGSSARAGGDSATGRKSKIPPPSLLSKTIVSRRSRRRAASRPPMSCASATSPMSRTTGPRPAAAAPKALDTVPSIPLAPRLQSTRGGSGRAGQNVSMSRTGIEDATNSVACSGSSTPSSAATDGSLHPLAASTPRIASAARSSALRQLASQSGSIPLASVSVAVSGASVGHALARAPPGPDFAQDASSIRVSALNVAAGSAASQSDTTFAGSCQAPSGSNATWRVPASPSSHVRNGFETGRSPTLTTTSGACSCANRGSRSSAS